jgi:DNA-binding GntR family transcriptional regulator
MIVSIYEKEGGVTMKENRMLQDQAYTYLIEMIKQGELESDKIYSIKKMADDLGISRTPLRDAVMRPDQERYIDVMPSKGFRLHKMVASDIEETYQIRNAIESYCMKQLARNVKTERGHEYYYKLVGKVNSQKEIMATTKDPEAFGRGGVPVTVNVI